RPNDPAAERLATSEHLAAEVAAVANYLATERHTESFSCELNRCKKLSNAAGIAFGGEWRRWRFLHCPNLNHPVVRNSSSSKDRDNGPIIDLLRNTACSVMIMPDTFDVADVTFALQQVNSAEWRDKNYDAGATPPMLSAAFVRAVSDEGGDRLAGQLWEVAGASPTMISGVCPSQNECNTAAQ